MNAKTNFTALIDGVTVEGRAGEAIDKNLAPRVIAQLKTRGLITDRKPAAKPATKQTTTKKGQADD